VFSSLRGFAALLFWVGLVLAVVMYLAGPGRLPQTLRRWVVAGAHATRTRTREIAADEGLASWAARNIDALRVGGAVLAALALLIFASWWALLIVGAILAVYEVGVTLWARSAPQPQPQADATADEGAQPVH
jgi:hypothetical protein